MSVLRTLIALAAALVLVFASFEAAGEPLLRHTAWRALELHNEARREQSLPDLKWSADLAQDAEIWADRLAREGRIYHSAYSAREDTGENIWMGTAGAYSLDRMIGGFVEEKVHFRPGHFPDVSRTGRWEDVGHYSQIIWPSTQSVGCALAQGPKYDVLVCRYWPAGNVMGRKVGVSGWALQP